MLTSEFEDLVDQRESNQIVDTETILAAVYKMYEHLEAIRAE